MRAIQVTPRQAQVLDLLCEFGETDLIAYKLGLSEKTITIYINKIMEQNGYPNRLTLSLAWDRQKRKDTNARRP